LPAKWAKKENIKIRKNPVYSTAEEPEGPMKFAKVGKKRKYKFRLHRGNVLEF
jgi:hypothetical protein